jgi:hypothetical protein
MSSLGSHPKKIPRAEAISRLRAAKCGPGPNAGAGMPFEVWLTKDGYPQTLFYAGSQDYFWEHEILDAIKGV